MIELYNADKTFIKTKLKPYLEEDNFSDIVSMLTDRVMIQKVGLETYSAARICAFLYDLGLPILESCKDGTITPFMFAGTSLESIVIPSNIKTIGKGAFTGCRQLEEIIFEEGVESIQERAFSYLLIQKIEFPRSLRYIGPLAFLECDKLESIKFKGDATFSSGTFPGGSRFGGTDYTFYVPEDVLAAGEQSHFYYAYCTSYYVDATDPYNDPRGPKVVGY